MLTKIDSQLSDYDSRVGSSLQLISADPQGRISVRDLEHALGVIKHKPDAETVEGIVRKLDVDQDGFVVLEHVLDLVREEGLGTCFTLCRNLRNNTFKSYDADGTTPIFFICRYCC